MLPSNEPHGITSSDVIAVLTFLVALCLIFVTAPV